VVHVPYKGTPEAIGDTIGGRVCCYWAPLNAALPHVTGGKAVALAVFFGEALGPAAQRAHGGRAGLPGLRLHPVGRLWGPAGMPADVAAKINKDVNAALAARHPRAADQARHRAGHSDDPRVHRLRAQGSRGHAEDPAGRRHQAAIGSAMRNARMDCCCCFGNFF